MSDRWTRSIIRNLFRVGFVIGLGSLVLLNACNNDEDPFQEVSLTGNKTIYDLVEADGSGVSGTITLEERSDNSTLVTVQLTGTTGGSMPNHIHENSVVQGGSILVTLTNIDGSTGTGITEVSETDDGTPITYDDLLSIDGHVRVHLSETEIATIISDGDIGENVLTGDSEVYPVSSGGIEGNVTFEKRESGESLVTLQITGAPDNADHPSHIHANTAIEGGSIIISLNDVDAVTGIGSTHVDMQDDGTDITYDELIDFDGHVVIHSSSADFSKIATCDIGQNALTGVSDEFELFEDDIAGVEGLATFQERNNGETLVTITLGGPHGDTDHPVHIHSNSVLEGGPIVLTFNEVSGGTSETNVTQLDDGTPISYSGLIDFDGHIRVHASDANMGTIVATGDIGVNKLTGETLEYDIKEEGGITVLGTAVISERKSGSSWISIRMTSDGGDHPSHIHENSDIEGGSIVITLNNVVDGAGDTNVEEDDNGNPVSFEDLSSYNGHIKIHVSDADFSVIAHADIGGNALTGESVEYDIQQVSSSGVSGVAVFEERINGTTLVTMDIDGTTPGEEHPNHIHANSLLEGGDIIVSFTNINGNTGTGQTQVDQLDDGTKITYQELINIDGHLRIHKSTTDFGVVAQGDCGGNALTGESTVYQINEANGSGVSGTATFYERNNGYTLISFALDGTFGDSHPAHIHENSVSEGGSIVITFNNVDGTTGISNNNIEKTDSDEEITYADLINFNGHIRVHTSDSNFSVVAEGNIGSNVN